MTSSTGRHPVGINVWNKFHIVGNKTKTKHLSFIVLYLLKRNHETKLYVSWITRYNSISVCSLSRNIVFKIPSSWPRTRSSKVGSKSRPLKRITFGKLNICWILPLSDPAAVNYIIKGGRAVNLTVMYSIWQPGSNENFIL